MLLCFACNCGKTSCGNSRRTGIYHPSVVATTIYLPLSKVRRLYQMKDTISGSLVSPDCYVNSIHNKDCQ